MCRPCLPTVLTHVLVTRKKHASSGEVTIRVLGQFEVSVGGLPVRLTANRLLALLAVLAVSPGEIVSMERLAQAVWSEAPPRNVRRSLQTYAVRLRDVLGAGLIESRGTGLILHVDRENVDAFKFSRLLEESGNSAPGEERRYLVEALGLWRGEAFEGVDSRWLTEMEAPRLNERQLVAVERRTDLDITDHRHGDLVADLEEWVARHPTRETLWLRLLMVLDRCGRQAEALQRYEQVRQRLAGDLGVDPGPALQRAHQELLEGRTVCRKSEPQPPVSAPVPRQLPPDIDTFVGREGALERLSSLVRDSSTVCSSRVAVVTGTAGVGKTALAVHWAHAVADQFPDGQLYLNLRGFEPANEPMETSDVIRALLDALGTVPEDIPHGLDAQIGLYRTRSAGRRMLVVLDNARDASQVRPLLPAGSGCRVVVTSRNRLTGLVATESATPVTLDVLSPDEARRLIVRHVGMAPTHDPAALRTLGELCTHLPLALVIAAARLASQPHRPASTLAADLLASENRLDLFYAGDPYTDIRAVLSWSYRVLSPGAARLFRLLGSCRQQELSVDAAASLAAIPVRQAVRLIAELSHAHLITEVGGRYSLNGLTQTYAGELAALHDDRPGRIATTHRRFDHSMRSADWAYGQIDPQRDAESRDGRGDLVAAAH